MTRIWTDDQLQQAVQSSRGITEVIRKLYGGFASNNAISVWRRIAELKIDTKHFSQKGDKVRENVHMPSIRIRKKLLLLKLYKCEDCGNSGFHNGKPLTLHVDHIDGNRLNNNPLNWRWLCPNCHSQTPTYGKVKTQKPRKPKFVLVECYGCRESYRASKWRYERKKEKGQVNFYCSLKRKADSEKTRIRDGIGPSEVRSNRTPGTVEPIGSI